MPPKKTESFEDRIESLERALNGEHGHNGLIRKVKDHENRLDKLDVWVIRACGIAAGASLTWGIVLFLFEWLPKLLK